MEAQRQAPGATVVLTPLPLHTRRRAHTNQVTKIPRWDLNKFAGVSSNIGSAMTSVGEVMSIGRTWEESMQKAMRMVDPAIAGFQPLPKERFTNEQIDQVLQKPTPLRIYAIAQGIYEGTYSVDDFHDLSKIDHWFLERLQVSECQQPKLKI